MITELFFSFSSSSFIVILLLLIINIICWCLFIVCWFDGDDDNDDKDKDVHVECCKSDVVDVVDLGTRIPDAALRVMNQIEQGGGDKRKAHAWNWNSL